MRPERTSVGRTAVVDAVRLGTFHHLLAVRVVHHPVRVHCIVDILQGVETTAFADLFL